MPPSDLLARFLAATKEFSSREAAALIGVSHATVAKWRAGAHAPLLAITRRAIAAYLEERDPAAIAGNHATEEVPADVLDLPDGAFLKPRAQAFYRERLGEYLTRGWPDAMVREAARSLISALDGGAAVRDGGAGRADELSEADQLLALTAGAGHVEKYIGARWRRST